MVFFPLPPSAYGVLPGGAEVIHGDVGINSDGTTMNIDQATQAAIVNWLTFSIGLDNAVNVNQPDFTATMLSRVVGSDVSDILGSLTATGHFYLVNPNGIFFGQNATIDTGALIASTLDISDSDFLAGQNIFSGDSDASIIAEGMISADDFVTLIAKQIENRGTIRAPGGSIAIAAADAVLELDSVYGSQITIDISGISGDAINTGVINVSADTLTGGSGGAVIVVANNVSQVGLVLADADGKGRGGYISFASTDTTLLEGDSMTSARGGSDGEGGEVRALGDHVGLFDSADVDVSGGSGGGTALIGGGFQGNDPEVDNASATFVSPDATVSANAESSGDGGTVVVWSDESTRAYGHFEAKGGADSDDGGLVEVSGKAALEDTGTADTSAAAGETGTLLLDPTNADVNDDAASGNVTGNTPFEPTAAGATFTWLDILTNLGTSDVVVRTTAGFDASEDGDITIVESPDAQGNSGNYNVANDLTFNANGDLFFNAVVTNLGSGDLTGTGNIIDINFALTLTGGSFDFNAQSDLTVDAAVSSGGGNIDFIAGLGGTGTGLTVNAAVNSANGDVALAVSDALFGGLLTITSTVAAGSGEMTFTSDEMEFSGAAVDAISGTGNLTIRPANAIAINLGNPTADLNFNQTDIDRLADGFASITISDNAGGGDITISPSSGQSITFDDSLTLNSAGGGDIRLQTNRGLAVTGATSSITLDTPGGVSIRGPLTSAGGGIVISSGAAADINATGANTGNVSTSGGNISITGQTISITGTVDAGLDSGDLTFNSTLGVTQGTSGVIIGDRLDLQGNATDTFNGLGTGNGDINTLNISKAAGTVNLQGGTEIDTALTIASAPNNAFALLLTGGNSTIGGNTDFTNTGELKLGNASGDSAIFVGGLNVSDSPPGTAPFSIGGTLATTDSTLAIADVTLLADTTLRSGSGNIGAGAVTGVGKTLTVQANTGGSTGTVTFDGALNLQSIVTFARNYDILFNQGAGGQTSIIANVSTLQNTGTVTFGNNNNDSITFTGGLTRSGGPSELHSVLSTTNTSIRSHGSEKEKVGLVVREWFLLGNHP